MGWEEVRVVISGAAALPNHLNDFLKHILPSSAHVFQGYAMTESAALASTMTQGEVNIGHCGIPFDNVEMRVQSVPKMKYSAQDYIMIDGNKVLCPRGEIQLRGPSVFREYFKNAAKTAETKYENGWLRTGDIVRINPNGTISIIDRTKNMFKTACGEYIAVEKVEGIYGKAASVHQIYVYGNGQKNDLMAAVVPAFGWAYKQLRDLSLWTGSKPNLNKPSPAFLKELSVATTKNKDLLQKKVLADMQAVDDGLKKYEKVKDIVLETGLVDDLGNGFNVANNCLTPTFKLRRNDLKKRYIDAFKALYTKHGQPPKEGEEW